MIILQMNDAFKRHISHNFPSLEELARQVALCFVIGDEFLNPSYPIVAKVVYIGGAGLKMSEPVPEVIKRIKYLCTIHLNTFHINHQSSVY